MMRNRNVIKTAIVFLLVLTFISCYKKETIAGKNRPVTLVISSRLYTPLSEQKFLYDEIFPSFEEENNVVVKFEILDDDILLDRAFQQKETGRITSDVVIVHNSRMKEWVDGDLVEILPVEEWKSRTFSQAFTTYLVYGGKTYFAPVGGDVYLLLANRKALQYLDSTVEIQNLTWSGFADWSQKIKSGEGSGKVAVTGVPQKNFIYFFGAMVLSYGGGFPIVRSYEANQCWNILASMSDTFFPGVLSCDNVSLPMKNGEAWLAVAHMARIGEAYRQNPDDYIIAPAPRGPSGIGSIAGTSGFAVLKGAENKDMAFRFIEYMTRPEIAVKVARGTGGFLPPINEAIEELGNTPADTVIKTGIEVLQNGVVSGVPGSSYTSWGDVKQIYDDLFSEMILNRGTVDDTLLHKAEERLEALRK
ncbi:ABC transporter substrate-binding protein [Spirochaeta isovalerica]|uniref:Multiple sugar transport system substrate-binding protein n=1 Tax=Spirochaeta isovalerica TaxID=150 RepID=A0A841R4D4_9SPIO|nr:ABC transporter substrate-binding protein [Spirochaeta isovalerica]MBB6478663.1 multiple sugar transport system substrate-binding protein [Spirochaeta isovalerica]